MILGSDFPFYRVAYNDIIFLENVRYFQKASESLENTLNKLLCRINYNQRICAYCPTPFFQYLKNKVYIPDFKDAKPVCFLCFDETQLSIKHIMHIKKKNPTSRFVLFYQDLIALRPQKINMDILKQNYDLIISYDKNESIQYDISYHPTPFSIINLPNNTNIPKCDIYFCGSAKSRYKEILNWYEKFSSEGLDCNFYIYKMPKSEQLYKSKIHYDEKLSYIENLQHVTKCKAVLEIMQKHAVGYTPRLWETIAYDKHLLTNNQSILSSEFYNMQSMHILDPSRPSIKDLISSDVKYSDIIKNKMSPLRLLKEIDNKLKCL